MAEAARRLDLTPAAVAYQVKALEKDLATALIMRAGRTVVPTPEGYRLLEKAPALLSSVADFRMSVHSPFVDSELRLGTINTALHSLLPEVLKKYNDQCPKVRVHVRAGVSHQLFHDLQEDNIDAAICLHPPFVLPKTFGWLMLHTEPLVVIAPWQLAHHQPLELIQTEPFIRYDRKLGGGKQADAYLRTRDITPQAIVELDSLLSISLMVHYKLGVSLIPQFDSPLTASLEVTQIPLPDAPKSRSFGVLWKRASVRMPLIQPLLKQTQEVYRQRYDSISL